MKKEFTLIRKAAYRLSRLSSALQQIYNGNRRVAFVKYQSISRQLRKLTRKALSSPHMAAKVCGAFALSVLLSGGAEAQCNTFSNADAVNPIINGKLPKIRKPVFVDIDGDGDLDCYAPRYIYYYSAPLFFKNTGTNLIPNYTYKADDGGGFTTGLDDLGYAPTTVQFADIDGDGDYDCFMSEAYDGSGEVHIRYYENQGTAVVPHFVENQAKNPLKNSYGFYFLDFTLADIDGDGDVDAFTRNWMSTEVLENTGTKTNPVFFVRKYDANASAGERNYIDWDKDGLTDYFEDNFTDADYYHNIGSNKNPRYVLETQNAPHFTNGFPHSLTDLNGDGSLEAFNGDGGYATVTPVPSIDTSTVVLNGKNYVKFTISPSGSGYTYQTYKDGKPIKGARYKTYIASANGVYSFTISNDCGTGVSRPYKVKYSNAVADFLLTTGNVSSLQLNTKAVAYPNPFTNYITLKLPVDIVSGTVQVTDIQGRILIVKTITGNQMKLGENLMTGTYVINVIQKGQKIFSQKIVKE